MSATVVRCDAVSKSYGDPPGQVTAVHDVTLSLRAGEVMALMGPSGSGKTTLLSLVGGLLAPSTGRIRVAGVGISELPVGRRRAALRGRVGFVFQRFLLLPELSACENVALGFRLAGQSWERAHAGARVLLRRLGLGNRVDARPSQLSAGEQQRVGIARGLGFGPRLLLADEPTGNLDWETGKAVIELMVELARRQGTAVMLATHDDRVVEYATRLVRLTDGALAEDRQLRPAA